MNQLNELELQNLRHLVISHSTAAAKLTTYADQCSDPKIKQMFQQSAQDAQNTIKQLMSFLG